MVNRKTSNICASQFKLETHSVKILEVQEQKVFRGCMCILGSCLIFLLLLRCCCVWLSCTAPAPRAASFPEPSREQTPGGAFAPQRGRLCRALHTGEARPLHQPSQIPPVPDTRMCLNTLICCHFTPYSDADGQF